MPISGCATTAAAWTSETREHIFEPFFTTKPVGQGTGLGLAVAHGIVEAHRGAISVTTAPGQGSTFDVYLPLVDQETQPVPLEAARAKVPQGAGQHVRLRRRRRGDGADGARPAAAPGLPRHLRH